MGRYGRDSRNTYSRRPSQRSSHGQRSSTILPDQPSDYTGIHTDPRFTEEYLSTLPPNDPRRAIFNMPQADPNPSGRAYLRDDQPGWAYTVASTLVSALASIATTTFGLACSSVAWCVGYKDTSPQWIEDWDTVLEASEHEWQAKPVYDPVVRREVNPPVIVTRGVSADTWKAKLEGRGWTVNSDKRSARLKSNEEKWEAEERGLPGYVTETIRATQDGPAPGPSIPHHREWNGTDVRSFPGGAVSDYARQRRNDRVQI